VAVTSVRVVRLRPGGAARWSVPLDPGWGTAGGVALLEGGDALAWAYTGGHRHLGHAAGGPLLVRLRLRDGHVVWRTSALTPALTDHSLYVKHAEVEVRGEHVLVADEEGSGRFLEVLSLGTGEVLRTWRLPDR
jgi:hypothetical protein